MYNVRNKKRLEEIRAEDALDLRDEIALTRLQIEESIKAGDKVGSIALLHALTSLCRTHVRASEFSSNYLALDDAMKFASLIMEVVADELRVIPEEQRFRIIDAIANRIHTPEPKRLNHEKYQNPSTIP